MNGVVIEAGRKTGNIYDDEVRARLYDASVCIRQDGIRRAAGMDVAPHWTVLDIGAGPGTLAVPLAERVMRVDALEPSAPMRELLHCRITEEGVENIEVIPATWEAVYTGGIEQYDLVIASYSLLMNDWEEAIAAMNRTARRRVDIYWFDGETAWGRMNRELYPKVHGREYAPGRGVRDIVDILADLGIYPRVEHLEGTSFPATYRNMDAALEDLRRRLGVSTDRYNDIFRAYIRDHFLLLPGGAYLRRDDTVYTLVSWRKVTQ